MAVVAAKFLASIVEEKALQVPEQQLLVELHEHVAPRTEKKPLPFLGTWRFITHLAVLDFFPEHVVVATLLQRLHVGEVDEDGLPIKLTPQEGDLALNILNAMSGSSLRFNHSASVWKNVERRVDLRCFRLPSLRHLVLFQKLLRQRDAWASCQQPSLDPFQIPRLSLACQQPGRAKANG